MADEKQTAFNVKAEKGLKSIKLDSTENNTLRKMQKSESVIGLSYTCDFRIVNPD